MRRTPRNPEGPGRAVKERPKRRFKHALFTGSHVTCVLAARGHPGKVLRGQIIPEMDTFLV